jgi:hypothetical protein
MAKELGGGGRVTSNAFVSTTPTALMVAATATAKVQEPLGSRG